MLFILGSFALTVSANARPRFFSESVENIYNLLPEICKQDLDFTCKEIVLEDTVKLNYQIDKWGALVHIGYNFFNIADSMSFNRSIIQFLEREFLKWIISSNEDEILLRYSIDNVFVKFNNRPLNEKFLKNKKELIAILNKTNQLDVYKFNNNYSVEIFNSDGNKIEFIFPNDPKLISGMDKKERDDFISYQLKNHEATNYKNYEIDSTKFEMINDTTFILPGDYYLIPEINDNIYIQKKDSLFQILVNDEYMNETFTNTMLGLSIMNYKYTIQHVKYGYNIENYVVYSKDFYDFFSIGYNRYFGIETCYKDNLSGTLIFQDQETEYIHLARIKSTMDDLHNENNVAVKLYTNIPRSSLKNLFGEIEEIEKIENNENENDY